LPPEYLVKPWNAAREVVGRVEQSRVAVGDLSGAGEQFKRVTAGGVMAMLDGFQ